MVVEAEHVALRNIMHTTVFSAVFTAHTTHTQRLLSLKHGRVSMRLLRKPRSWLYQSAMILTVL
jgi:uncharacterized membrane protein